MRQLLKEWTPVIGLMLLAGVLRFYELGSWPPGLYHDEAFNGLDALRVIAGERPLYFAANNGREPFFIYLVSLSVQWLGRSVYALRLPAAVLGTLTIPATYWMARQFFTRRTALLAAVFMTITLWPIHLSLISLRAGSLPLFIALSLGAGVRAYKSGRALDWLLAGAIYGLSFYTYLASRFSPLALVMFGLLLLAARRFKRLWPGAIIYLAAAAVVVSPLIVVTLNNWDVVMGRPGEVSIFNPAIHHGDVAGTIVSSVAGALGLFNLAGDSIARHNVPYRPVFDALVTIVFVLGLVRLIQGAVQRTRSTSAALPDFLQPDQQPAPSRLPLPAQWPSALVLIWIGVMLLPTMLAEDAPHFLRAVGVLPVAMLIPAVGLDTLLRWFQARGWRAVGYVTAAALLVISTALTITDYSRYVAQPETAHAFEAAGIALADAARPRIVAGQPVIVAERFTRDWASVPFLLAERYEVLPDDGQLRDVNLNLSYQIFVWPYETSAGAWWRTLDAFITPRSVKVLAGPAAQGDLDPQPHTGYLEVQVEPLDQAFAPEARLANGLDLLGHSIQAIDERHWRLQTLWRSAGTASPDETIFAHLLLGGQLADAQDGDSGGGFYPIARWRTGDVIIDERVLTVPVDADPARLLVEVGVYHRGTGQRARVVDNTQAVIDNAILLGGPGAVGP